MVCVLGLAAVDDADWEDLPACLVRVRVRIEVRVRTRVEARVRGITPRFGLV